MFWRFLCVVCVLAAGALAETRQGDVFDEFYTFDVTIPKTTIPSDARSKRDVVSPSNEGHLSQRQGTSHRRRLQFDAFGQSFDLDLKLNPDLVPDGFQVAVHSRGGIRTFRPPVEKCHYRGTLNNAPESNVAVSLCNGGVSGFIQDGHGETFYLTTDSAQPGKMMVMRESDKIPVMEICGVDLDGVEPDRNLTRITGSIKPHHHSRTRRSLDQPSSSDRNSLYVELVMVGDTKLFEKYKKNETLVINRFVEIASIVNALYTPLDIFVVLAGVEIWTDTDKIAVSNDSETTLKNFLRYRKRDLIPRMPNDNAYLISFSNFEGSVVGKALKGQMCTYEYSGGIAKDHSSLSGPVGATVAHELGHNFGMEHDFTDCKCPEDRCIMTPASVGETPSNWSSCSKKYLEDHLARGIGTCLKRAPKTVPHSYCGNGFLEEGEECDCGPKEFCRNRCCLAETCTLSINSTCGHGSCCDLHTCSPKPAATTCRESSGECDLPEYCDGHTGACPRDFWTADGVPCRNGDAYCYDGSCKTHDDQCQFLWGSTGREADNKCFLLNAKGNANGNCGHDRITDNYTKCASADNRCGLLHCSSQVDRLVVGSDSATSVSQSYIPASTTYISCKSAYVDFGLSIPDPGLVPSGAKCGTDMMCLNQICTPIAHLPHYCPNNCGSTGVCNNAGHCHCHDGYSPPDCLGSGYGGSIDSNPSSTTDSYRRFRDAMLIIFLVIVPVMGVVIYLFRFRIREWLIKRCKRGSSRRRSSAPPAASATVKKPNHPNKGSMRGIRISEPVPVKDGLNDTVVSLQMDNGRMTAHTQLSPESWPVIKEQGYFPPSALPPPLPSKPPKAVREIPVATVTPVVPVPQVPFQSPEIRRKKSAESPVSVEDVSPSVRPVRPAPAPPPQPTVTAVSRNSSTSSSKRQRPLVRPPDPPPKPIAKGGGRSAADKTVIANNGRPETKPMTTESSLSPKNTLVSELARRFESRRAASGNQDNDESTD
ncbi:Disintegrin and metalloproteinase domain-containing protein 12 [Hypsibius exemplaris]|uniref:Disintegrin and metalloproteinase domain-containing protein 12 n=1 Tax=Hypsibius exemplaris TaxID=2072580 RepID=A0A1W0WI83_HYPEX|nr:Disintegrin and metalloproteinase domain-containing protein 12 [Hypsibius exemplaris]